MSIMHWSPNLSIDNEAIDEDHKGLIADLNALGSAIEAGALDDVVLAGLDRLIASTRAHFSREEQIMRDVGYPDMEPHRRLHGALIAEIDELRQSLAQGDMEIGGETLDFIRTWLTSHILESDKTLGGFLKAKE